MGGFNRIEKPLGAGGDEANQLDERNEVDAHLSSTAKQIDAVENEVLTYIFPVEGKDIPSGKWKMKQTGALLHLFVEGKRYDGFSINLAGLTIDDGKALIESVQLTNAAEPYNSYVYTIAVGFNEWGVVESIVFEKTGEGTVVPASTDDGGETTPTSDDGKEDAFESTGEELGKKELEKKEPTYLGTLNIKNPDNGPKELSIGKVYYDLDKETVLIVNALNSKDVLYKFPLSSIDEGSSCLQNIDGSLAKFTVEGGKMTLERVEDNISGLNSDVVELGGLESTWEVSSSLKDFKKTPHTLLLHSDGAFTTMRGKNFTGANLLFPVSVNEYNKLQTNGYVLCENTVRGGDDKEYQISLRKNSMGKVTVELKKTGKYRLLDEDGNELVNGGKSGTDGLELLDKDEYFTWNGMKIIGFKKNIVSDGVASTEYEQDLLDSLFCDNVEGHLPGWISDKEQAFAIKSSDALLDTIQGVFSFEKTQNWVKKQGKNAWQIISDEKREVEIDFEKRVDTQGKELGRGFELKIIRMPEITEEDKTHDIFKGLRNTLERLGKEKIIIDVNPDGPIIPDFDFDLPDFMKGWTIWKVLDFLKSPFGTGDVEKEKTVLALLDFDPGQPLKEYDISKAPYGKNEHYSDVNPAYPKQMQFASYTDFGPRKHPDGNFLQIHNGVDYGVGHIDKNSENRQVTLVKGGILDTTNRPPKDVGLDKNGDSHDSMNIIHNKYPIPVTYTNSNGKKITEKLYPATEYYHIDAGWSKNKGMFDKKGYIKEGTPISFISGDHLELRFRLYRKVKGDGSSSEHFSPVSWTYEIPQGNDVPKNLQGLDRYKGTTSFNAGTNKIETTTVSMDVVDPTLFYELEELGLNPGDKKPQFLPLELEALNTNLSGIEHLNTMGKTADSVLTDFSALEKNGSLDSDVVAFMKRDGFRKIGLVGIFQKESGLGSDSGLKVEEKMKRDKEPEFLGSGEKNPKWDEHVGWFQISRQDMVEDLKNNVSLWPKEYIDAKLDAGPDYKKLSDENNDIYFDNVSNTKIGMCYLYAKAKSVKLMEEGHADYRGIKSTIDSALQKWSDTSSKEYNDMLDAAFDAANYKNSTSKEDIKKTIDAIVHDKSSHTDYKNMFKVLAFYHGNDLTNINSPSFAYAIAAMNFVMKENYNQGGGSGAVDELGKLDDRARVNKLGLSKDDFESGLFTLADRTRIKGYSKKILYKESSESHKFPIDKNDQVEDLYFHLENTNDQKMMLSLYESDFPTNDDLYGEIDLTNKQNLLGVPFGIVLKSGPKSGKSISVTMYATDQFDGKKQAYFVIDLPNDW